MMTPITEVLAATGAAPTAEAYPIIQWVMGAFFAVVAGLLVVQQILKPKGEASAALPKPGAHDATTYVYLDGPMQQGLKAAERIADSLAAVVAMLKVTVNEQASAAELEAKFEQKLTEQRHSLRNEFQDQISRIELDLQKLDDRQRVVGERLATVEARLPRR